MIVNSLYYSIHRAAEGNTVSTFDCDISDIPGVTDSEPRTQVAENRHQHVKKELAFDLNFVHRREDWGPIII